MSHDYVQKRVRTTDPGTDGSGHQNLNSTGVKMLFAPATPIQVSKWGFIPDATFTASAALTLALNTRATIGGSDVQVDTLTVGANVVTSGVGYYRQGFVPGAQSTGSDGSLDNVAPTKELILPGQAVSISVTTAAGVTATGIIFIEFVEKGFIDKQGADVSGTPAQVTLFIAKAS